MRFSLPRLSRRYLASLALICAPICACYATQHPALPMVRYEAERDLDCDAADIRIEEELSGFFTATGCGRRARYRAACEGLSCTVSPENGPAIPWRDRPPPTPVPQ